MLSILQFQKPFAIFIKFEIVICKLLSAWKSLNSLANDKILNRPKLKAFADDNLNVAKMMISLYDRVENIVGKGENAGYQHFLLFLQCFQKASSIGSGLCGKGFNTCTCMSFGKEINCIYFMLSGWISRNIGENIFQSYTGTTSENTDFHVLVA